MRLFRPASFLTAAAASVSSTWAQPLPDLATELANLKQQVAEQQQVIQQQQRQLGALESRDEKSWLNDRRAQEVKALIHEVLADADTRASLLADGATAGYAPAQGFFIASADGLFNLRVGVEAQIRHTYSHSDQNALAVDEDEGGFSIRRGRLDLRGNAITKDFTYRLRLATDRATGNAFLEYAYASYKLAPGVQVTAGQIKPLFIQEESVGGFQQLTVERSYTADYFTIDYTTGVEFTFDLDKLRLAASVHDGSYGTNTEFNGDRTDIALTTRAELLLAGDWKQFRDHTSFNGEPFAVLLGAAIDYEIGESGNGTATPDLFKYSTDVSVEFGGANLFAALYGQAFDANNSAAIAGFTGNTAALDAAHQIGFVVQGGIFVVPDKLEVFSRYEWINFDGAYYRNNGGAVQAGSGNIAGDDSLSIVTAGVNYYFAKHAAKFTFDVQFVLDPVPVANTGGGVLASPDDGQVVLRSQFQFGF